MLIVLLLMLAPPGLPHGQEPPRLLLPHYFNNQLERDAHAALAQLQNVLNTALQIERTLIDLV